MFFFLGTFDSINNMFDVRARAGTTDSIGSIIDVNRSLSDDIFDTVVAQIADDGGFNYDEFSQGKPVVKMITSKGILSQVEDDYYEGLPSSLINQKSTSESVSSLDPTATRERGVGADLFNFDNDYMSTVSHASGSKLHTGSYPFGVDQAFLESANESSQYRNGKYGKNKKRSIRRRTVSSTEEKHEENASRLIGKLSKEERRRRIDRWLEKRKHRNWSRYV